MRIEENEESSTCRAYVSTRQVGHSTLHHRELDEAPIVRSRPDGI